MSTRNYWLILFSETTWQEFLNAGAQISGFREGRWKALQQIRLGDYLLCYLTRLSRWVGVLEVVSEPFKDDILIWQSDIFPCRLHVKMVISLTPETAIPITLLRDQLSIFERLSSPFAWTGHVRSSPTKWKTSDGEVIVNTLLETERNPISRPITRGKPEKPPTMLPAKIGSVTVPGSDELQEDTSSAAKEPSLHTEIQWLLLKLGNDMGLDVWVANNDRSRTINGYRFTELPRIKKELPLQFDAATNKTIELIDVLWLKGNAIVAAFEIECTTSIYSGLLRMADLIAMQPNLNIPLYLVAPDERRNKVVTEVNRPTFSRLSPPMKQMCRFISIPTLQDRIQQIAPVIKYLKEEFLMELSESCALENDI
jgi:hypothetical protein